MTRPMSTAEHTQPVREGLGPKVGTSHGASPSRKRPLRRVGLPSMGSDGGLQRHVGAVGPVVTPEYLTEAR